MGPGLAAKPSASVLVTGANCGLGLAMARTLAREGHSVIATARCAEQCRQRMYDLNAEGLKVQYFPMDVTNSQQIHELLSWLDENDVQLDGLINNAAICMHGWSKRVLATTFATNTIAPIELCKLLWRRMPNDAHVVNVSSGDGERCYLSSHVQGLLASIRDMEDLKAFLDHMIAAADSTEEFAFGPTPAYSVSKAALNVATTLLAATQGRRICAVCPGDVQTKMCSVPYSQAISTSQAATDVVWALLDRDVKSGAFYRHRKQISW